MSSKERSLTLNYDEVLEYIGQFGTFQKKIFFLLWLVSAAGGLAVVVFAFTGKVNNTKVILLNYFWQVLSQSTDAAYHPVKQCLVLTIMARLLVTVIMTSVEG